MLYLPHSRLRGPRCSSLVRRGRRAALGPAFRARMAALDPALPARRGAHAAPRLVERRDGGPAPGGEPAAGARWRRARPLRPRRVRGHGARRRPADAEIGVRLALEAGPPSCGGWSSAERLAFGARSPGRSSRGDRARPSDGRRALRHRAAGGRQLFARSSRAGSRWSRSSPAGFPPAAPPRSIPVRPAQQSRSTLRCSKPTTRPLRADSRAASRISVTIRLFSSDDEPGRLDLPAHDGGQVAHGIVLGGGERRRARPPRRPCPPGGSARHPADRQRLAGAAVDLEVLPVERPVPRRLDDPDRLRPGHHDRGLVVHARVDVGLERLGHRRRPRPGARCPSAR